MKTFINKTFLAVVATVLVAGTAFFTSCEKDVTNNTESRIQTETLVSKSANAPSVLDVMREYYSACDDAYSRDSVAFLLACNENDIVTFNMLIGLSDAELESMQEVLIATYNNLLEEHPEFNDGESSCPDCVAKALPRIGAAVSATAGNLAGTVPTALDYDYGMRFSKCMTRCLNEFIMGHISNIMACVHACMLELNPGDII